MLEKHIAYASLHLYIDPLSSEQYEINAECPHLMIPQVGCQRRRGCHAQKSFPFYQCNTMHRSRNCSSAWEFSRLQRAQEQLSLRRPLMKSLYTLQSVSIMSLRHPGLKIIFFLLSSSSLASISSRCPLLKVLFFFKPVEELPLPHHHNRP